MRAALCAALLLTACGRSGPPVVQMQPPAMLDPTLAQLPILVGELAFNEPENTGFDGQYEIRWSLSPLLMKTDGTVSATLIAEYLAPAEDDAIGIVDALFWQVRGTTVWTDYGDKRLDPWSETFGVLGRPSSQQAAAFELAGAFRVPPESERSPPGFELVHADLDFTWVRQWNTPFGPHYQVLAASGTRYGALPAVSFDQVQAASGRFDYYRPIPIRQTTAPVDYISWFASH